MAREDTLIRTLVELADTLTEDFGIVDLLTLLVQRCVEILDISSAGLMLVAPEGDLRLVASSSETMRILELFELQSEEGPCLDCYRSGQPVLNEDLATVDGRWPTFAPVALADGFRSAHALPMRLRGRIVGALNLFSTGAGDLSAADVLAGQALVDMATIAVLQYRAAEQAQTVNEQLNRALTSRILIEQAKGVLAERSGIDVAEAFSRLRGYARNHNLRIADVAQATIDGTLLASTLAPHESASGT